MSMIDDFVEYSAGPSRPSANQASRTVAGLQESSFDNIEYEGYEVDEDDDDVADENHGMLQALETGFIPSSRLQSSLPPLFALSLVQFRNPPSHILTLVTANNLLFIASYPLSIMLVDLNKPLDIVTIDLPKPAPEKGNKDAAQREVPVIAELFVDPTARHLIATTNSGDAFYLPISPGNPAIQSRRPRPLRLRQTVTAVAWSPLSGPTGAGDGPSQSAKQDGVTPPATDVLIGTASGQVLSLPLPPQDDIFKSVSISMSKPLERDLQTVYTLLDQAPVMGLAFGFWPEGEKPRKRGWVVVTTKDRVYEVQGSVSNASPGKGAAWAEELFKPVRDSAPKFQELPGDPPFPDLRLYLPTKEGQSPASLPAASHLAWITGPGLYASSLSPSPVPEILQRPTLIPYPSSSSSPAFARSVADAAESIPISITITEWHYLLLYVDRIVAITREDEKVVWSEALPLGANEQPVCLSSDPISQTFWVCTTQNVLEVLVRQEERDVWRAKLEKKEYVDAFKYAKTKPQKDIVLSRQADALFEQGRFIQAAQAYAKSSRSFEYVTLRFVDADERDALRIYLSDRLDLLDKKDRTQRMMLATWLVEIYLSKCNTLEDIVAAESATSDVDTLSIERQMMEEDMRNFITTYQHDLEPKVVYELIQSHGRTDLFLFYAKLNKDHAKVVEHWVTEERWVKVIDILNRQESLDLYYRFSTILMRNAPKEIVDSWLRRSSLSPRRLVPALLQHTSPSERDKHPETRKQAIRYLNFVVSSTSQPCTDPIIYNLLLTLYATAPADSAEDEAALLQFLSSATTSSSSTDQPYFDLDYALRLCKANGKTQACVHLYSKLGLYEDSVDLALSKGDLDLAKINADRPEGNDELRKKLWLKVAKYVVQEKNDIQSAMAFLESTDLLKIEDILPFFPDFVVIDDFKAEICSALQSYATKIDDLRREMDDATLSAENIKRDIAALSERFVTVEQGDRCWKCGLALLSKQFYAFGCQHVFHVECLITMVTDFLPGPQLRRLLHLQNELVKSDGPRALLSQNYSGSGSSTPLADSSQRRRERTRDRELQTSGNTATDLLLGVSGRNKLFAAGDRLREMIIPDALAQAVTTVGSSVVSGVPLPSLNLGSVTGGGTGKKGAKKDGFKDKNEEMRLEGLTRELDELVAAVCPLCEGCVLGIDKGFIGEGEDVSDWEV